MDAAQKKVSSLFSVQFCVLMIYRRAYLLVLFHQNAGCCSLSNVLAAADLVRSGYILARISMTTLAKDFKFAGAIV